MEKNINYNSIREALALQDLSAEEKQRRGILARLYGPCASIIAPTRNGRMYSDELWEKVFTENEIVKEMFHNGGICMELDHPQGREETDSTRIAAMLPCAPTRDKDGHLICYVDIIDTPCGKIAYQLAKYGFKLGISSRGSGDVLPDDSVDPDTYDFTTFDLVLLPAVKDARLTMCESLDKTSISLKKALTESYNELDNQKDRNTMKEVLEHLDIDVNLTEASEEVAPEDCEITLYNKNKVWVTESIDKKEEDTSATVGDIIDQLKEFDKDTKVEFSPIIINDTEYPVEMISAEASEDDKKVIINIDYTSEMSDNIKDEVETDVEEKNVVVVGDEETDNKVVDDTEEVIDDETDELVENLKEAIRQKNALESEIKSLKSEKTVSDAEVGKLTEELNKYKAAFTRTSEIAAKAKKSEADVKKSDQQIKKLTEQLSQKTTLLRYATTRCENLEKANANKLNENVDKSASKVKVLTEKLNVLTKDVENQKTQLIEQAKEYKKKLNERTEVAKKYKAMAENALTEYINFRASMLGISPKSIIGKLNEDYSIAKINSVCDNILNSGMPDNPFKFGTATRSKVTESKVPKIDDELKDLYELAGLNY